MVLGTPGSPCRRMKSDPISHWLQNQLKADQMLRCERILLEKKIQEENYKILKWRKIIC